MKVIFEDVITRYEARRGEFIVDTWPKRSKWREAIRFSSSPKAEECIDEEMELYRQFESELEDIPKLRNREVTLAQWDEIVHFLKVHNERLSAQVDNSTTVTATFVFLASISALLANFIIWLFYFAFCMFAYASFQVFIQRIGQRTELARNRELVIIIENYVKKRRAAS